MDKTDEVSWFQHSHFFMGFRWCAFCGFRRGNAVHYLTRSRRKVTGKWL